MSLECFGAYNTATYIISFNYPKGSADRGTIIIVPDFQMRYYLKRRDRIKINIGGLPQNPIFFPHVVFLKSSMCWDKSLLEPCFQYDC